MSEFLDDYGDPNIGPQPKPANVRDGATNKALVAFVNGKGYVLIADADEGVRQYLDDFGNTNDFDLDAVNADYEAPKGHVIVVATMRIIDDGPGDWPGSREAALQLTDMKPVTDEEWKAYREGDWPWWTTEVSEGSGP